MSLIFLAGCSALADDSHKIVASGGIRNQEVEITEQVYISQAGIFTGSKQHT